MVLMHSSYSPLFTSGLLAERCTAAPSSSSTPTSPVDTTPSLSNLSQKSPLADDASAFYFTLQTRKRDTVELRSLRSFLYLDLAEYNRPVAGHRPKPSTVSKSTSWTCTTDPKSTYYPSRTAKPRLPAPVPPVPSLPTLRRSSKESLRTIPSPKPAPSTMLPDLPIASDSRPPSSFLLPSPIRTAFSYHRGSHSAPAASSASRSPAVSSARPSSLRSESISSHDRRKSRKDALACLEGRSRAPHRIPRQTPRKNFMSFSDDEDDKSTSKPAAAVRAPRSPIEDMSAFADVEDEADAIVVTALSRKRSAAKPPRPSPRPAARRRRSTVDTWFPLKSFIDFREDDRASWNWRSFVEIGGVA
ncbi:hypothetical protein BU15DRAFT_59392 [Melanogaster broomeanus]|nr:hypothetical protein BU15DRAFT_59392 [Melanogaster broomeanus]